MRTREQSDRGTALIAALMMVSLSLVYSNVLTMSLLGQHLAIARMREGQQALLLGQAAAEQLKEEFSGYVNTTVNWGFGGDMLRTADWLDQLGSSVQPMNPETAHCNNVLTALESPALDLDGNGQRDSDCSRPRFLQPRPNQVGEVLLPTLAFASTTFPPRAWVEAVAPCTNPTVIPPTDPLAPRCVVIRGEASMGSTHKAIRVTYEIAPRSGDVFRYAYFVNNFGWLENTPGKSFAWITGEMRSNGNLKFSGENWVLGDLYASQNSELGDGPGEYGEGKIVLVEDRDHDLWEYNGDEAANPPIPNWYNYWYQSRGGARPAQNIVWDGQIPIGGEALRPQSLPEGYGWKSEQATRYDQEQTFTEHLQPQAIPYIGDLQFYKDLAKQHGGSITYNNYDADSNGTYGDLTPRPANTNFKDGVYVGPDGVQGLNSVTGRNDDYDPLVLWGDGDHQIVIDGPIVVPGDVIIRGMVTGWGSIFAGRNIHIVGSVDSPWERQPRNTAIERNQKTGQIRNFNGECNSPGAVLGWICQNGDYYNASEHYVDPVTGQADPTRLKSVEHPTATDCGAP